MQRSNRQQVSRSRTRWRSRSNELRRQECRRQTTASVSNTSFQPDACGGGRVQTLGIDSVAASSQFQLAMAARQRSVFRSNLGNRPTFGATPWRNLITPSRNASEISRRSRKRKKSASARPILLRQHRLRQHRRQASRSRLTLSVLTHSRKGVAQGSKRCPTLTLCNKRRSVWRHRQSRDNSLALSAGSL